VQISAKTGEGVPDLLDMMLLTADLEDFRGDPSLPASGYVLESNLDPKKGLSATLIIKNGTLKGGQFVAAGSATAPVRIMEDFQGKPLKEATFSSPVRIIGWDKLPAVGEEFKVFETKNDALEFAAAFAEQSPTSNEPLPDPESGVTVIPVIVKGDTVGSLEAIQKELAKLSTEKVAVRIVQSGIGTLSENDLRNAEGIKNTVIVSFNAKIDATARAYALRQGLEIHEFNIIYKLTEWMEGVVAERTPKVLTDVLAGEAKVLKIFSKTKDRQVVGCRVESGSLKNGATVKVMRRDAEIGEGRIRELQHNKNKTSEVTEGMEFGALVEFSIDLAPADRLQAFETVER
jgi:translation initiation factor IF-2